MKQLLKYFFGLIILLAGGCSNPPITHLHGHEDTLELNDGKKWKVVPEMMHHLQQIEHHLVEFTDSEEKNYGSLAAELDSNLNLLTSNCTMKGKAHDELHKWLVPFMQSSDDLTSESSDIKRTKIVEEMVQSFKTFNTYFE